MDGIISEMNIMIDHYLEASYKKYIDQDGGAKIPVSKKTLPTPSKAPSDSLSRFGYKLSRSQRTRRHALKRAAKSRGTLSVLKRVNLIGNLSKSKPCIYETLREDVEYLKNMYAKQKIKRMMRKAKGSKK
jgi:hypothetical protein